MGDIMSNVDSNVESNIELFPHNEEAYQAVLNNLEYSNFAFLERATGTGKSYILIKLMANLFKNKRVLFVTLHDSMFNQLVDRDMKVLGTSKDIYEKLDCILYSSIPKHTAEWYSRNYDCIIFDEAHHCGAPVWGEIIAQIRDLIRNSRTKKMIGATATGTRYLDNYRDVAEEYFDGNVSSKLLLSEAILREILPAPFYVNINQNAVEILYDLNKKIKKLENYKELDSIRNQVQEYEKIVNEKYDIGTLLKKYDVKKGEKYIVFCENIKALKKQEELFKKYFEGIAPVEISEVHSRQSSELNEHLIKKFENSENKDSVNLMLAVDMFNEGLHIKDVDGIFMMRRTASPIIYLQQLGRALSFSSRKKQIKIFDLVGNATNINVIENLYKELISIAKEEVEAGKGKLEHYNRIIDRFRIVDEGFDLVDGLEEINNFLEEKYFAREKITRYIQILKNYTSIYHCTFTELLRNKRVDEVHLKVYRELRLLADSLTFENLMELSGAGIIVAPYQDDREVLEKIVKYGTYKDYKGHEIKQLFYDYNLFYIKNKRRPSDKTKEEKELKAKYEMYLSKLPPSKLRKYLKKCDYMCNLEELILIRDYPSKEKIEEYLSKIEDKYVSGIPLTILELKIVKIISRYMSIKDRPIIDNLVNNKVLMIDECIITFEKHLKLHSKSDFSGIDDNSNDEEKNAIKILNRYWKYVTNIQFEKLIELGVKLPKDLDMSIDERKEKLGIYDSFYEKEVVRDEVNLRKILEFISTNKRKPILHYQNGDNVEDYLAIYYRDFYKRKNAAYAKKITECLKENNVQLTIEEKLVSNMSLTIQEQEELYARVCDILSNSDNLKHPDTIVRKMIRALRRDGYIDNRLMILFLKTSEVVYELYSDKHEFDQEYLKKYIYNNQSLIPYKLVPYLLTKYNISIPSLTEESILQNGGINIAYDMYIEDKKKIDNYIKYLKENNERPPYESELSKSYRKYLSEAGLDDIKQFCNTLNSSSVKLDERELVLIGIASNELKERLFKELKSKEESGIALDSLDNRVYQILRDQIIGLVKAKIFDKSIKNINNDLKRNAISELEKQIRDNPDVEIDYDNLSIPTAEREKLEVYRSTYKGKLFIEKIVSIMEKEHKTYSEILDADELEKLNFIIDLLKDKKVYLELVEKLKKMNEKIYLSENSINIASFIKEYIDYVSANNKKPSLKSFDDEEKSIAEKYEVIKKILDSEELEKFKSEVDKIISNNIKRDFYSSFVDFVINNQRFPSILGETEEEKKLAKEFQEIGSKLPADQKKAISKLRSQYQMNTIEYAKRRKGL